MLKDRTSVAAAMAAGAALPAVARAALNRALLFKFRRDVAALNRGDYEPLLAAYAEQAVLTFNDGDHRWAGEHRGRAAIERFLANFVAAGIQGEIRSLYTAGWPWRLTIFARFDDRATDPGGAEIYSNRTLLLVHTRWGKVVRQEDYYEDTERILTFEFRLRELGIEPR